MTLKEPYRICPICSQRLPKGINYCLHCGVNDIPFVPQSEQKVHRLSPEFDISTPMAENSALPTTSQRVDINHALLWGTLALLIWFANAVYFHGCSYDADNRLKLQNAHFDAEGNIEGDILNESNETFSYAHIEINLYRKDDVQIGSTLANINNLEPGQTWHFTAAVFEHEANRFRVMKIVGF